jgi:hypothetical protein
MYTIRRTEKIHQPQTGFESSSADAKYEDCDEVYPNIYIGDM